MIKDVNFRVMSFKLKKMEEYYDGLLAKMSSTHEEELKSAQKQVDSLSNRLALFNGFPQNLKSLSHLKSFFSMG